MNITISTLVVKQHPIITINSKEKYKCT